MSQSFDPHPSAREILSTLQAQSEQMNGAHGELQRQRSAMTELRSGIQRARSPNPHRGESKTVFSATTVSTEDPLVKRMRGVVDAQNEKLVAFSMEASKALGPDSPRITLHAQAKSLFTRKMEQVGDLEAKIKDLNSAFSISVQALKDEHRMTVTNIKLQAKQAAVDEAKAEHEQRAKSMQEENKEAVEAEKQAAIDAVNAEHDEHVQSVLEEARLAAEVDKQAAIDAVKAEHEQYLQSLLEETKQAAEVEKQAAVDAVKAEHRAEIVARINTAARGGGVDHDVVADGEEPPSATTEEAHEWLRGGGFDPESPRSVGRASWAPGQPLMITPMAEAVFQGNIPISSWLRDNGAEQDISEPFRSRYALHFACFGGHPEAVKWLLKNGAELDVKDDCGQNPAHFAAMKGRVAILQLLAERGAAMSDADIDGDTPMHVGAMHSHGHQACEWLVIHGCISDLLAKNKEETTPTDVICDEGDLVRCRWLHDLKYGDGTPFCDASLRSRLLDAITMVEDGYSSEDGD